MRNRIGLFLALILVAGFLVRLYKFDGPIADWHSWRQADTSAVSRNFVNEGYDVLHPRFDDLSNVASHLDNPQGYRFVEFPIYNLFQAGFYSLFKTFTIEEWGRFVTIFASLFSAAFLFLIFKLRKKETIGLLSAFFFLFIPFNIFYGRTILPDELMVTASLGGIYFFQRWLSEKKPTVVSLQFIMSLLFTAAAFLLKPYEIFFIVPLIFLAYEKFGKEFYRKRELLIYATFGVLPLILWRIWMIQYPEGIPDNLWLINGNGIMFHPAFFRWIFYERLTKLISGYFGILIFLSGVIAVIKSKEKWFYLSFGISSLLYVFVFATGNVMHDYYQILIIPSVAVFFAFGTVYLSNFIYKNLPVGKVILALCLLSLFYFGWKQVNDYYNINNPSIIEAGKAVDKLIPKDAKIIANYNGDTAFLYQTKRKGWPLFEKPFADLKRMGADYLVLVNPNPADLSLKSQFKIVSETKNYIIYKL